MINRLISLALTQRAFVVILALALVGFGLFSLANLPIQAFPDVQDVQVRVISLYPGQAPQDVERSVTLPVERGLAGIPHLTNVRSVSMTGLSIVTLTFADGTDDYFARQQVLERLSAIALPAAVASQLAPLSTAVGEVYRYRIDAPGMSETAVRTLQDWTIRTALLMTPGVADVVSFGGSIREFHVDVDPVALQKYQLSLDQLSKAVADGNSSTGGGLLSRGETSLVVRSEGLYVTAADIGRTVVTARSGRPILVADVATVHEDIRTRSGIATADRLGPITEGIVLMTKGGDPAKVNADLKERIAALQATLPKNVRILPIYDRTLLVHNTVSTVAENLIAGALLVISVLLIFLTSWQAALIVATVIPLALLSAFILMNARGVSANLISLGAVDFGIIIDSAVVIVEAVMVRMTLTTLGQVQPAHLRHHRLGILHRTIGDMAHPVLFSKAIIILAFLPIFTFQRVEGRIFAPVAETLSFALVSAVLLTFTLVPALLSMGLRGKALVERHKPWLAAVRKWYSRKVLFVLRRPRPVLLVSLIPLAAALLLAPRLGSEFLPKLDEGNIWLTVTLPTSAALETSQDIEKRVRGILLGYREVAHVISQIGRPDDGSDPKGPGNLEILVDLKPHREWRIATKDQLIADMSRSLGSIPGVLTNFSQVIEDNVEEALSGFRGEIVAKIIGDDLNVLDQKAAEVATAIRAIPGASDVDSTRIGGQAELVITPDRSRMARYGLSMADTNALISTALAGTAVTSIYEADKRFDVVVRLAPGARSSVDAISTLQLPLPGTQVGNGSGSIALADVASIWVRQGASRILRESGARVVIVKVNVLGRDQGSFVADAQRVVSEHVHLPAGYHLEWGGQFENSQRAVKRLMVIIPMTVLLIFSLLFGAFRSVRLAVLVLGLVPFTLIGGLAALGLAGLHLSISAAVGFIAVAGISVQNGVIMVEEILRLVRGGTKIARAIIHGASERLRAILMTALMAGLGLLPAALSHGIGSETQRPFACVIVGGIVSGTLFALFLLPVALGAFGDLIGPHDSPTEIAT